VPSATAPWHSQLDGIWAAAVVEHLGSHIEAAGVGVEAHDQQQPQQFLAWQGRRRRKACLQWKSAVYETLLVAACNHGHIWPPNRSYQLVHTGGNFFCLKLLKNLIIHVAHFLRVQWRYDGQKRGTFAVFHDSARNRHVQRLLRPSTT
jgi:hypothetical protein